MINTHRLLWNVLEASKFQIQVDPYIPNRLLGLSYQRLFRKQVGLARKLFSNLIVPLLPLFEFTDYTSAILSLVEIQSLTSN